MQKRLEQLLESVIFASRWVQAPMYLGLVVGSILYCYRFLLELLHMVREVHEVDESVLMLSLLSLVDVTMVANLVIMVAIGGYSIFVSRMSTGEHEDHPEWLEKTNAATLKIKLASSLVGVSGIHLLKSFINIEEVEPEHVKWRVIIHIVFLISSLILTFSERILYGQSKH